MYKLVNVWLYFNASKRLMNPSSCKSSIVSVCNPVLTRKALEMNHGLKKVKLYPNNFGSTFHCSEYIKNNYTILEMDTDGDVYYYLDRNRMLHACIQKWKSRMRMIWGLIFYSNGKKNSNSIHFEFQSIYEKSCTIRNGVSDGGM